MTNCCAIGALSKLSIGGVWMDFNSPLNLSGVIKSLSDGGSNAIRGKLDHSKETVAEGLMFVRFPVTMNMTALKMNTLLPLMGLPESPTDNFDLSDTHPDFTVVAELDGSKVFTFAECKIGGWRVAGQKGRAPVQITLDIVGKGVTEGAPGSFNFGTLTEGLPYSFTMGTLTHDGTEYKFDRFAISANYQPAVEHFNSLTATSICATDHTLTIATSVPYSTCESTTGFVTTPLSGDVAGESLSIAFERTVSPPPNKETVFNFLNVKQLLRLPAVVKNDINRLPLQFTAYGDESDPALSVTNIS